MRPGDYQHRARGYGPPGGPRGYGGPPGGSYGGGRGGGSSYEQRGYGQGPPPALPPKYEVDREKTCPLLLRVFVKEGQHHAVQEYKGALPADDELQMYTWHDATLRELAELIQEVRPEARGGRVRLAFSFVYPDHKGNMVLRRVGAVHGTKPGPDDHKTLHLLSFQTGDYLDVAVLKA